MDQWTRDYNAIATMCTALATLAGLDKLATRIKPTARKRAGQPTQDENAGNADNKEENKAKH